MNKLIILLPPIPVWFVFGLLQPSQRAHFCEMGKTKGSNPMFQIKQLISQSILNRYSYNIHSRAHIVRWLIQGVAILCFDYNFSDLVLILTKISPRLQENLLRIDVDFDQNVQI